MINRIKTRRHFSHKMNKISSQFPNDAGNKRMNIETIEKGCSAKNSPLAFFFKMLLNFAHQKIPKG